MSILSDNIRDFRIFRGLTQQELANKLHKAQNTIANWEKGQNSPDVDIVVDICNILDITPNQLYGWDKCPELEVFLKEQKITIEQMQDLIKQKENLENRINEYANQLKKRRKK